MQPNPHPDPRGQILEASKDETYMRQHPEMVTGTVQLRGLAGAPLPFSYIDPESLEPK